MTKKETPMCANPIQDLWLQAQKHEQAGHPEDRMIALAAMNGPHVLNNDPLRHLLEGQCEHCEQLLLHYWGLRLPDEISLRVEEWPETGAYGTALRAAIAEREQR
jgi:hypothetical protein